MPRPICYGCPGCMADSTEVLANAINALSIGLAGRRNVHTWWTGIVASVLFIWVFARVRLYADASLQIFFIVTSILGWWRWVHPKASRQGPVRNLPAAHLIGYSALGVLVTLTYAMALHNFTDAAAPLPDSALLATSVLGQMLLVDRRVESWYFWLLANTIAVPLYISRGLYVTAALYCLFWVNAIVSLRYWRMQSKAVELGA